jgi:protein required for attachment to host cells
MQLPNGAVVALVDGERFELYRNTGDEAEPSLSSIASPSLDTHNKGAGARPSSRLGNPTGHQIEEDAHAIAVADWLNQEVLGARIRHVVVIAAPRTLGEMRPRYSKQLQSALVGELPKDLAGRGGRDIIEALRGR